MLIFLFIYVLLEKSSFSSRSHKIKFVFHLGMFSTAGNGRLDYNGLNNLFHWPSKKSKGGWLLALAKPLKTVRAEGLSLSLCLSMSPWSKDGYTTLGIKAASRHIWRKWGRRVVVLKPYLLDQKWRKSSQSPQQPSIFVLFGRICSLTTREAEKVAVLGLHTLFSLENWCWVAREGQAEVVQNYRSGLFSSCHWSPCLGHQTDFSYS